MWTTGTPTDLNGISERDGISENMLPLGCNQHDPVDVAAGHVM